MKHPQETLSQQSTKARQVQNPSKPKKSPETRHPKPEPDIHRNLPPCSIQYKVNQRRNR
ncbi:hypothetical protein BDV35DRAFT_334464 [Aspergillus flavus]|uniref:Uncharacterized protein n=1 Tax=Aspergillus flavus TaxID=5059 RepID=A0A5N6HHG0_ASPFL|nr:hypothetical protein BDV35DRAFT_334464 [Aspergillus flavus]